MLGQLLVSLGKGDTEAKQAAFEASGGLQLIQQLGDQGHRRLAKLVAAINFLFHEQVGPCLSPCAIAGFPILCNAPDQCQGTWSRWHLPLVC